MVEQGAGRPLDRFLEQKPRQESAEQENRIVLGRRQAHFETDLKNERPTQKKNERMNYAPEPARCRPDEPLLEITANELEQQRSPFHQIAREVTSGQLRHEDPEYR